MDKAKLFSIVAVIGLLMTVTTLFYRQGLQAQSCPPGQTWVCVNVFDPSAGQYVEHCSCCGSGEDSGTPAAVLTPPPTATPFPDQSFDMCVSDGCPPGETRYALVYYECDLFCYLDGIDYLEPCCGAHCPCEEATEELQPCGPGNGWINCSEFNATVQAGLPTWRADREPYPRALVTLPERVWVVDLPSTEAWGEPVEPGGSDCNCRNDGSCDEDSPPEGTVCEYRLGLKIDPGNEPPTWSFEECGSMTGPTAQCGWERSSWGKPELGVGLGCESLPAYTVHASVPYWWSFGRKWEQWEQVGQDCDCVCRLCENPNGCSNQCAGQAGLCTGAGEFWKQDCDPVYGWKRHGPNWELLDLTDYGWPTPYMRNPNVQLVPHPPCEPNPPVGAIYVPCIEVQAPIEKQP